MRRAATSSFVPDAWVFPGGIVEKADGEGDAGFRACAAREMAEEAGIRVAAADLVLTARWVTPVGVPKRFDTCFFLAAAAAGVAPAPDKAEAVELRWITPRAALDDHAAGRFPMVFPTLKNLEALLPFPTVETLLAARRGATVGVTRPVIVVEGTQKKVVLPDGDGAGSGR